MLDKMADEIMNAIKEAMAHDTSIEDLRTIVKEKLEDARELGYSDGVDNEREGYYV